MKLLQRLVLVVVIATAIRSAVTATPVASAQQKRTETNTEDDEDDEVVDKRDDDDDDDDDDEVRHQIQLDVDVVKRRRGGLTTPTVIRHCFTILYQLAYKTLNANSVSDRPTYCSLVACELFPVSIKRSN